MEKCKHFSMTFLLILRAAHCFTKKIAVPAARNVRKNSDF